VQTAFAERAYALADAYRAACPVPYAAAGRNKIHRYGKAYHSL
jgi:hypothetical protein